jgi:diguanylate cyclase (GGDEF)-like protein
MTDSTQRRRPRRVQATAVLARLSRSRWLEPLQAAVLACVATAMLAAWSPRLEPLASPIVIPWWGVALLATVVGLYLIRLEFRHDAMVFTLDEIALVLGLFFAGPAGLLVGRTLGAALARAVHIRSTWNRWWFPGDLAFAGTNTLVETILALLLFDLLRSGDQPLGPAGLLSAFAATAISGVMRNVIIELAVMSEGTRLDPRRALAHMAFGLSVTVCTTGLALAAVVVLWLEPRASWVLLVPAGMVLLVYHAATKDRARQDTVKFLYEATKTLQDAGGAEDIAVRVLTQARDILRAESARLLLLPAGGRPGLRTQIGPGEQRTVMEPVELGPGSVWARHVVTDEVVLLADGTADPALATEGVREAMVAPLTAHEGRVGVLVVANRVANAGAFHPDELQLLETLANHTSVALENVRLLSSLREAALHDSLTGLANRTLLLDRTEQALARARRTGRPCALLLLDLDDFKTVNDSLGHAAGDQLLITVSERIKATLRLVDTPARLGGDEFAILLDDLDHAEAAATTAQRLIDALGEPAMVDGREIVAGGSVGVAVWNGHASPADLLRDADAAMYAAKRSGKGTVEAFRPDLHRAAVERLELETALRRAVRSDEIGVEYQPVVAVQTGRIVAIEAVVRWRPPGHTRRLPTETFGALAEETGLVVPIGRSVLDQACRQLGQWRDRLGQHAPVMVAVSLSPLQLRQRDLAEHVAAALAAGGLHPRQLELAVTEDALLEDDREADGGLSALRGLGVQLAIDDFGAGHSSLASLRRARVDTVKIDGSCVAALTDPDQDPAMTHAVIRMAQALDLQLVAEGVETAEQLRLLAGLRCPLVQGGHLAPPMPAEALTGLLAAGPIDIGLPGKHRADRTASGPSKPTL